MNWIEQALDEIGDSAVGDREHWKSIILSHAPVIDAEKLAKKIDDSYFPNLNNKDFEENPLYNDYPVRLKEVAQLITDSIDLNITWVDGKSRWGKFELEVFFSAGWGYRILLDEKNDGVASGEAPTKQACEKELRGLITGVKE